MGTGPVVSVFGEHSFYQETWGTRWGGRHVAKCSSDPRLAVVKLQGRDLVRIVGFITRFALLEAGTRGKFVLSSSRGNEPRKRVQGAPSRGTPRESQANFRVGTV